MGGGGGGGGQDGGGLSGPPLATAPPTPGLPHLPQTSVHRSSSCRSRAFTASASSLPCSSPAWRPQPRPPPRVSVAWGKGAGGLRGLRASERGSEELSVLEREGRGEGDVRSSHGRGPCRAPLGAPWASWAPSPSGVAPVRDPRWESCSRERKDAPTGSYGNRVADPAQHSMVVDGEEMGFEGGS